MYTFFGLSIQKSVSKLGDLDQHPTSLNPSGSKVLKSEILGWVVGSPSLQKAFGLLIGPFLNLAFWKNGASSWRMDVYHMIMCSYRGSISHVWTYAKIEIIYSSVSKWSYAHRSKIIYQLRSNCDIHHMEIYIEDVCAIKAWDIMMALMVLQPHFRASSWFLFRNQSIWLQPCSFLSMSCTQNMLDLMIWWLRAFSLTRISLENMNIFWRVLKIKLPFLLPFWDSANFQGPFLALSCRKGIQAFLFTAMYGLRPSVLSFLFRNGPPIHESCS